MKNYNQYIGQKFGYWTILSIFKNLNVKQSKMYAKCLCKCNIYKDVCLSNLLNGSTKSCGCYNSKMTAKRNFKHGKSKTKEYKAKHDKKYRDKNKEKLSLKHKEYYQNNKEEFLIYQKQYSKNNNDKICNHRKNRIETDLNFKIKCTLRTRIHGAIKGSFKAGSTISDLGCTVEFFKQYIELKFQSGMTWDNWEKCGWHLDHIIPLSSFDLTDREQFLKAAHYTNYQPLWAKDNLAKGAKLPHQLPSNL